MQKIKTGSFVLHSESMDFLITRNDSIQTEIEKQTGKSSQWQIEWLNDCKYKLKLINEDYNGIRKINKGTTNTFEIIHTTSTYYVFRLEVNLLHNGYIDTLWKVN